MPRSILLITNGTTIETGIATVMAMPIDHDNWKINNNPKHGGTGHGNSNLREIATVPVIV